MLNGYNTSTRSANAIISARQLPEVVHKAIAEGNHLTEFVIILLIEILYPIPYIHSDWPLL